jgi:MFS transporter, DHA2 family, glioxin efflux transporter
VDGIQTAFIVAIALAAACTIIAFGTKWQKLQSAPKAEEANSTELSIKASAMEAKSEV